MAVIYPEYVHRLHSIFQKVKSVTPFGRYPIHRDEPYAPFFIIGSGRSGNTLLRRILTAHPALHIPPETYVLGLIIQRFRYVSHMEWNDIVRFIYAFFQFHPEFETFGLKDLSELVRVVGSVEREKRSLAFIINEFYTWHAQQHGITFERWGDKTPLNVYCLERTHQVFPKAQFVHILRDGVDVVCSYLEAGIYETLEEAAWRWRTAVRLCQRFGRRYPRSYLEVRYEDLVTEPRQTVEGICQFLEVPFDESMLQPPQDPLRLGDVLRRQRHSGVLKPISASNIGKGRRTLSEEQKRRVGVIIGKELRELGYSDVGRS